MPIFSDFESEAYLNKINPNIENTFIKHRHNTIVDKYDNLKRIVQNFKLIAEKLDGTKGNYFDLNEPKHEL